MLAGIWYFRNVKCWRLDGIIGMFKRNWRIQRVRFEILEMSGNPLIYTTLVFVISKTGVTRNSLSNPYKAKQTLERLNFETYFFKGGPSDLGTKILQKYKKNHRYTPKAFCFTFIQPQYTKAIRQQEKLENYYDQG